MTEASGIGKVSGGFGLTAVAADFDDDGWPDIYVACDSTPSLLFHNNHDGTFTEEALERGAALSDDGMEQAGMGVGVGDFQLNGRLGIVKTHFRMIRLLFISTMARAVFGTRPCDPVLGWKHATSGGEWA